MLMWTVYCTLLYTNPSPICIVEMLVTEKEIHVNKTVIFVRYIHKQTYIFVPLPRATGAPCEMNKLYCIIHYPVYLLI